MKQKLLLTLFFTSCISFAQAPISKFVNNTETEYAILDNTTTIDESATGANTTWNFTSLTQIGTNTDTNVAPTSGEMSTYIGATEVLVITTDGMPPAESRLFIGDIAGDISIIGLAQDLISLNFSNSANLGTFPLSYTFSNADTVGGTFLGNADGTMVSGTFSGTLDTDVDAHGTLNLNDFGLGAYNGNVTRLKTELNISLVVAGFFNIGTVTQIGYYYYDDTDGSLVFRSSTNIIDIDAFGTIVDETIRLYEAQDRSTLGLNAYSFSSNDMMVFPNPVSSNLNIKLSNDIDIISAQIMDLNGRTIIEIDDISNSINVSHLQSGMYLIAIETSNGNYTKRFIKK